MRGPGAAASRQPALGTGRASGRFRSAHPHHRRAASAIPRDAEISLTTDLSRHAAYAHSRGGALARALCAAGAAETRSLYVQPPRLPDEPVSRAEADAEAQRELIGFLHAEVPAASGTPRVRDGDAASEIVAEAREWSADLVVLGTHGRRGARRLFLGSVAETVLRHAPCAALVIPPLRTYHMEADHAHAGADAAAPAPPEMAGTA